MNIAPSAYTQRAKFMKELSNKRMEKTTFKEIISKCKVTTFADFKKPLKIENPEDRIEEVNKYLNEEAEAEEQDNAIDTAKIRELEGDIEEDAEGEDPDFTPDGEGEGQDDSEMSPEDKEEIQEVATDILESIITDLPCFLSEQELIKRKELEKQKLNKIRALEIEKLKRKIIMKQRAGAFLDNEAELGSDHEDNDTLRKAINNMDTEEILDRRLEFETDDIEGLIDNQDQANDDADDLMQKVVQDHLASDTKDTVNLITAIKKGHRGRNNRNYINAYGDENDPGNSLYERMGQKQRKIDEQSQILHKLGEDGQHLTDAQSRKRIIQNLKDEGCDDDEQEEIVKELMARKYRK